LQEVVLVVVLLVFRAVVKMVDLLHPQVHLVEVVVLVSPILQQELPELHNHQHQRSLIHQGMLVVQELMLLNIMQVVALVLVKLDMLVRMVVVLVEPSDKVVME